MNPQTNQDNGLNLPQPQAEGVATMPLPLAAMSAVPVAPPVSSAEPPLTVAAPVLRPTVPVHEVSQQAETVSQSSSEAVEETPAEAADNDVIEREWVVKAKAVVAETKHDPYKQVQELNKIKADYMKKRYDKDIKLADA